MSAEMSLSITPPTSGAPAPSGIPADYYEAAQLDGVEDAEAFYVEHHLHPKLQMDLDYLRDRSVLLDLKVVVWTLKLLLGFRR